MRVQFAVVRWPEVVSALVTERLGNDLRVLLRLISMWPGCLTCRLLTDAGDNQTLTLVSEWDSREGLDGFLESREFLILQGMRVVLREEPQVILDEILLRSRISLGARTR